MPLSWNEIRDRSLPFSREWANECSEDAEAERVAFLFERYQQLTAPLAGGEKTTKKRNRREQP